MEMIQAYLMKHQTMNTAQHSIEFQQLLSETFQNLILACSMFSATLTYLWNKHSIDQAQKYPGC